MKLPELLSPAGGMEQLTAADAAGNAQVNHGVPRKQRAIHDEMSDIKKDLPNRKSTRLKGYDYSQNGLYFITFCTHNKNCHLGRIFGNVKSDGSTEYNLVLNKPGAIHESPVLKSGNMNTIANHRLGEFL